MITMLKYILIAITILVLIVNIRISDFENGWKVQFLFTLYLLYLLVS